MTHRPILTCMIGKDRSLPILAIKVTFKILQPVISNQSARSASDIKTFPSIQLPLTENFLSFFCA